MKSVVKILAVVLFFGIASNANAAVRNSVDHPYYLHALSDLRAARWMIEHRPGNWAQTIDEINAVKQIDAAIKDIQDASIVDGKDINDHPLVDERNDHDGRLHEALDFLKKAHEDINHDEDNSFARGLRNRSFHNIDLAMNFVKKALHA